MFTTHSSLFALICLFLAIRLWHQLTTKVEEIIALPYFITNVEELYNFYDKFIKDFEQKINQLKLATMIVIITRRLAGAKNRSTV